MPTYEYACLSCGHHIEVFQHFSDEPLTACGVCGGPLRKVFHPAGILFKGSGFYATDSRSSRAGAGRDGADSGTKSKGESSKPETSKAPADGAGSAGSTKKEKSA